MMMKRAVVLPAFIVAVVLCGLGGCAGTPEAVVEESGAELSWDLLSLDEAIAASAADIAGKLPEGTRVAIVAFESSHLNLSDYIMRELTGALVDGRLEVADRSNLPYITRELNIQMSGAVSDKDAVGIGHWLGAKYVITGEFTDLGRRCRYRLNGFNVKTAGHESSTRLDVRNDQDFREMFAALQKAAPVVKAAGYEGEAAPKTAGTFLDRGIACAGRKEWDKAIADFSLAIEMDPDLTAAWMLRGRARYASVSYVAGMGENFSGVTTTGYGGEVISGATKEVYDRAIADFTQVISLEPDNKAAYGERGNVYNHKEDYDRAIADYSQAIRLDPESAAAYVGRGAAYRSKKDYDRAIADYNQAIRLAPEDAAAYFNRGNAYGYKKDYDRAMADFNQAIRLDPELAMAYIGRGLAYAHKTDYDRAIADYHQAIRLDPEFGVAYNNRGNAYKNKGDYDRAIADYDQAIRLNPEYAEAYHNRGLAYHDGKKDYDRAIADYDQAIRLNPEYVGAYNDRGNVYYDQEDYDRAIADYSQAIRLNPEYMWAYYHRGLAYDNKTD
jgi:tetratricopeptide (TPR) repeat protein